MKKMEQNKSAILIFGGTGYIGRHMVGASLVLGHPTYVYCRPNSTKTELLQDFESKGGFVVQGELDEHDKLVSVLKKVDIVICALAYPQVLDQLKIIEAIKVAGNIKRFLPSDFGVEEDKVITNVLPPFRAFLDDKRKIRRAVEEANIPYTFVSANCFGSYFVNYLLRPHEDWEDVTVYGTGEAKEKKTLACIRLWWQSMKEHAIGRVMIYRPPANILSQLELISLWEKKTGRILKRIHVPENELIALSESLPHPQNIPVAILHSVFVKGVTMNFELGEKDLEASTLYPDLQITTVDHLLDIFLSDDRPKPASAAFC